MDRYVNKNMDRERDQKQWKNTDKWTDKNMDKQKDKKWKEIQTKIWTSGQMADINKKWTNKQTNTSVRQTNKRIEIQKDKQTGKL